MRKFLQKYFNNSKLKYVALTIIAVFFFTFGYFFANFSSNNLLTLASTQKVDVSKLLEEIKSNISSSFIPWNSKNTLPTDSDLDYGMLKGYVNAYKDPYTQFFTPNESKQFEEDIKGSFGGIGAMVGYKDNSPIIMTVLKDTPAEKAGLKAGDLLVSADGKDITTLSVEEIVRIIRGEIGTDVKIQVTRPSEKKVLDFTITRAEVKTPIIDSETKDGVFIIHFYSFTEDSAQRFEKELQTFLNSGRQNLIIDVRGNGGGYLESAIDIASLFLPKDKTVVVEKNSKFKDDVIDYSKGYNYLANRPDVKVAVLVDGGSASASEILAGALKDNNRATIIGEKTFGKGSVQQLIKLSDGSDLKLTVAKWYTPNGVNISENGIEPDQVATSSSKITLDSNGTPVDAQLMQAIKIIKTLKK